MSDVRAVVEGGTYTRVRKDEVENELSVPLEKETSTFVVISA